MKSKELIALLQKEDPDGDTDVCTGISPVVEVYRSPAYYDGSLERLIRDEQGKIISAKIVRTGDKIVLRTMGLDDAIFYALEAGYDLPVDLSDCSGSARYAETIAKYREESRLAIVEADEFVKKFKVELKVEKKPSFWQRLISIFRRFFE